MEDKLPNGRPTKYLPEMDKIAEDLLADGKMQGFVALKLGIDENTYYTWKRENKTFCEAIKRGLRTFEAEWIKKGEEGLTRPQNFSAPMYIWLSKNRLGWGDKATDRNQPLSGEISVDGINQMLKDGEITSEQAGLINAILTGQATQKEKELTAEIAERVKALEEIEK